MKVPYDEKNGVHFFSAVFHPFLFILAGNDDMHESSDEFEFRPRWLYLGNSQVSVYRTIGPLV